jgi:hypothetical protein
MGGGLSCLGGLLLLSALLVGPACSGAISSQRPTSSFAEMCATVTKPKTYQAPPGQRLTLDWELTGGSVSRSLRLSADPQAPPSVATVAVRCAGDRLVIETDLESDGRVDDRMHAQRTEHGILMEIDRNADHTVDEIFRLVETADGTLSHGDVTDAQNRELYRFTTRRNARERVTETWVHENASREPTHYERVARDATGNVREESDTQRNAHGSLETTTSFFGPDRELLKTVKRRSPSIPAVPVAADAGPT